MTEEQIELNAHNVMRLLEETHVSESRREEFYAVAQLLALGQLSTGEQKALGEKCVKMLETDNWWRSNGAFNDE